MKKLILAISATLLIGGGLLAQQDTTRTGYRNMQPQSGQDSLPDDNTAETPMPNNTESNIPQGNEGNDTRNMQQNDYNQKPNEGYNQRDDGDNTRNMQDDNNQASIENNDIEVVKDKEGPNHEVVYKYQGELYYVDREQQELIKANESQLRDSDHKVIVKEPTIGPYQENERTSERRSGAGRG